MRTPSLALTEPELRGLSVNAKVQSFPRNAVVVSEGDQTQSVFIIRSGRVKVYLRNEEGREVVLNVHGPGEYFGEMALDESPRSASVVTLEPSKLIVVPKRDFKAFLSVNPEFAAKLIDRLMQRVRDLTGSVRSLALLDVYGRVARLLLELAVEKDGKLIIPERLTQKDIAQRVGASREMISRIFKELVAGGYLEVSGQRITLRRELPSRR